MAAIDEELAGHTLRNDAMWVAWVKHGVNASTPLDVDFHFYSAREAAANALAASLKGEGLQVKMSKTRTLLILSGWAIEATRVGETWSLEKLQSQTRHMLELAQACGVSLEGLGAEMPE